MAPGLMVALLASLLVPSLIVDGRKLQQVQSFEEAQVLAEAFLEDFLREFQNGELGSAAKTEAPAPAPAAGLLGDDIDLADFFGEDFYDEIFGPDAPDEVNPARQLHC